MRTVSPRGPRRWLPGRAWRHWQRSSPCQYVQTPQLAECSDHVRSPALVLGLKRLPSLLKDRRPSRPHHSTESREVELSLSTCSFGVAWASILLRQLEGIAAWHHLVIKTGSIAAARLLGLRWHRLGTSEFPFYSHQLCCVPPANLIAVMF